MVGSLNKLGERRVGEGHPLTQLRGNQFTHGHVLEVMDESLFAWIKKKHLRIFENTLHI